MLSRRLFSSSSNVIVPVKLYSLEGRYATALYAAAVKSNSLSAVESEMQKIKKVIEKSKDMISFFNDLSLSKKVKKAQVQSILSANKYSPITLNFFNVVADNGRLAHTTKIINGFEEIMKGHRNEVTVTISSAKELDAAMMKKIVELISKKTGTAIQSLNVTAKVDANLVGGLLVEIGEKTIDLTVSSKINKVNKLLEQPI